MSPIRRAWSSKIEEMFETGRAPYPVERTLIVSGVLESCLDVEGAGRAAARDAASERAVPGAEEEPARAVVGSHVLRLTR